MHLPLRLRSLAHKLEPQAGAAFVEFAIICILFFAVIGFFFEFSIAYFHYQLLVATTTAGARAVSVNAEGASCSTLEGAEGSAGSAATRTKAYFDSTFSGISSTCVRFCGDVLAGGGT